MTDDARDDEDEEKAQTPEELRATLDEYRASLAEVTEGLRETPEDEELLDLGASLVEVIEITEDVLASTVEASSAREEEEVTPRLPTPSRLTFAPTDMKKRHGGRISTPCAVPGTCWYRSAVPT